MPRALVIFNAAGPPYAENYPEGKTVPTHTHTHIHTRAYTMRVHTYTTREQHVVGRGDGGNWEAEVAAEGRTNNHSSLIPVPRYAPGKTCRRK